MHFAAMEPPDGRPCHELHCIHAQLHNATIRASRLSRYACLLVAAFHDRRGSDTVSARTATASSTNPPRLLHQPCGPATTRIRPVEASPAPSTSGSVQVSPRTSLRRRRSALMEPQPGP